MAEIMGLIGLRPDEESVGRITCPPYDVIKPGSPLEDVLSREERSLYHITLGKDPLNALHRLLANGYLREDSEPCFYIYEQKYGEQVRTGILAAARVYDYDSGEIIKHEKIFYAKMKGRLELRAKTGYTYEPVFLLTKSKIGKVLDEIKQTQPPLYEFTSCFHGHSDLDGIKNRIYRLKEESPEGCLLQELIAANPLYIADGHHRYHASLLNKQTHCLGYICQAQDARIIAYNRVINGLVKFASAKNQLNLVEVPEFKRPPKHQFAIYTKSGCYLMKARKVGEDVVGKLDCSILEKELYPALGFTSEMIRDTKYFDYYPEYDLHVMRQVVQEGKYDLAIALHPVSIEELMAVADAGVKNPAIIMPEKSTFFAPKILSGLFIYRHTLLA